MVLLPDGAPAGGGYVRRARPRTGTGQERAHGQVEWARGSRLLAFGGAAGEGKLRFAGHARLGELQPRQLMCHRLRRGAEGLGALLRAFQGSLWPIFAPRERSLAGLGVVLGALGWKMVLA